MTSKELRQIMISNFDKISIINNTNMNNFNLLQSFIMLDDESLFKYQNITLEIVEYTNSLLEKCLEWMKLFPDKVEQFKSENLELHQQTVKNSNKNKLN
jgi:hypothetical protein